MLLASRRPEGRDDMAPSVQEPREGHIHHGGYDLPVGTHRVELPASGEPVEAGRIIGYAGSTASDQERMYPVKVPGVGDMVSLRQPKPAPEPINRGGGQSLFGWALGDPAGVFGSTLPRCRTRQPSYSRSRTMDSLRQGLGPTGSAGR